MQRNFPCCLLILSFKKRSFYKLPSLYSWEMFTTISDFAETEGEKPSQVYHIVLQKRCILKWIIRMKRWDVIGFVVRFHCLSYHLAFDSYNPTPDERTRGQIKNDEFRSLSFPFLFCKRMPKSAGNFSQLVGEVKWVVLEALTPGSVPDSAVQVLEWGCMQQQQLISRPF